MARVRFQVFAGPRWREMQRIPRNSNIFDIYTSGTLLNVNGQLHLIGNNKHWIWNNKTEEFCVIHDFQHELDDNSDVSLINIPSNGMLIMIAGFDDQENSFVWKFCIKTRKWMKIQKLPFLHEGGTAVSTSDEKYIIISDSEYIHVLEMKQFKLYQSSLKVPSIEPQIMKRVGGYKDVLLVTGWIKSLFKSSEFQFIQEPPMYLKKLISQWFRQEEIHWLGKISKRHFVVHVKDILSSLKLVPKKG